MRSFDWLLVLGAGCSAGQPSGDDASTPRNDAGRRDAAVRDATTEAEAGRDVRDDALSCHSDLLGCWLTQPCEGCCVARECVPSGASCGLTGGTCLGTSCSGAGGLGEACATVQVPSWTSVPDSSALRCAYEPWTGCTATNAVCDSGQCVHCGLTGEPCCAGYCAEPASCFHGVCTKECGAIGQQCCVSDAGNFSLACDDGSVCLALAAGVACVPSGVCEVGDAGVCANCGNGGQSCCGDGGCNVPLLCDGYGTCVGTMK